jgi:hypothetical protein
MMQPRPLHHRRAGEHREGDSLRVPPSVNESVSKDLSFFDGVWVGGNDGDFAPVGKQAGLRGGGGSEVGSEDECVLKTCCCFPSLPYLRKELDSQSFRHTRLDRHIKKGPF